MTRSEAALEIKRFLAQKGTAAQSQTDGPDTFYWSYVLKNHRMFGWISIFEAHQVTASVTFGRIKIKNRAETLAYLLETNAKLRFGVFFALQFDLVLAQFNNDIRLINSDYLSRQLHELYLVGEKAVRELPPKLEIETLPLDWFVSSKSES